ncbi:MAG: hypothetical protein JWP27_2577 [Flaviaesturariibacter sp.]|nr:hypothetical protein [Flaviaesturariibacter sp.]
MKWITVLLFFSLSCGFSSNLEKQQFNAPLMGKKELVFTVPKGFINKYIVANNPRGVEEYYLYNGQMILYVGYAAEWPSENARLIAAVKAADPTIDGVYKGIDGSGFYWKEIQVDRLRMGYRNIPINLKAQFDQSLISVKIKNQGL